jgi:hypothetical protein
MADMDVREESAAVAELEAEIAELRSQVTTLHLENLDYGSDSRRGRRKGVKINFISKWLDLHAWQICAFCFLVTGGQLERYGHWYVYLPIQFIGFLMMGQYAKRYHARKRIQEVGDPCLIR